VDKSLSENSENVAWLKLEGALRENQRLAVAGQFAAAIMHDINNPLEAISNLNFLVQRNLDNAQNVQEYSRLIDVQLALVTQIARQTLSFYRSAGTPQTISISSLADAALRVHQNKIVDKQIRLLKNLSDDANVKAHPGEMLQVMSNLIANAVDALQVNGTLTLRVKKSEQEVHVTIADDGHGIPKEILSKVFDPFFTTKKERGTGLGLAITKAILEKHRGRIKSRSSIRDGRSGTAFRISLPIERDHSAAD
jgi:signal transduction histidine kinase